MENKLTFEEKMAKLNESIKTLQDDKLPLEEALKIYSENLKAIEELKKELDQAIAKVSLVNENNEKEDF